MSKKKVTNVKLEIVGDNIQETVTTTEQVEETTVEETTVEETKLDIEKFKLGTEWFWMSSEEYIKQWLKNILDEVKDNDNLAFQWLFIMYLEDMLSKIR